MLVPCHALTRRHLTTSQCANGTERKRQRLVEEDLQESTERAFQSYGKPLETITLFNYLGRVRTTGDTNWTEVVGNLEKAHKSWARLTRILGQEGADLRVSGTFFKKLVQAVLFFGSETWFLTP